MLLTESRNAIHNHSIFCFENHWLDYNDCLASVRIALNLHAHSSPIHAFTHILSRVHSNLFAWRCKSICNLDRDISATEAVSIQALESEGIDNYFDDTYNINLNILYNKHRALLKQNAKKWAQRSKINWTQNGDLNTSFFHNCARIRKLSNYISYIMDKFGNNFTD